MSYGLCIIPNWRPDDAAGRVCRLLPLQTRLQFGFFFNLDNDPGCDPQDTSAVHSQGLAALANVTG